MLVTMMSVMRMLSVLRSRVQRTKKTMVILAVSYGEMCMLALLHGVVCVFLAVCLFCEPRTSRDCRSNMIMVCGSSGIKIPRRLAVMLHSLNEMELGHKISWG